MQTCTNLSEHWSKDVGGKPRYFLSWTIGVRNYGSYFNALVDFVRLNQLVKIWKVCVCGSKAFHHTLWDVSVFTDALPYRIDLLFNNLNLLLFEVSCDR